MKRNKNLLKSHKLSPRCVNSLHLVNDELVSGDCISPERMCCLENTSEVNIITLSLVFQTLMFIAVQNLMVFPLYCYI